MRFGSCVKRRLQNMAKTMKPEVSCVTPTAKIVAMLRILWLSVGFDNLQPTFSQHVCRGDPSACGHIVAFLRQLHELNYGTGSAGRGVGPRVSRRRGVGGDNCSDTRMTGIRGKSATSTNSDSNGRHNRRSKIGNNEETKPRPACYKVPTSPRRTQITEISRERPNIGHHLTHVGTTRRRPRPAVIQKAASSTRSTERFPPPPPSPPATRVPPPPQVPFAQPFEVQTQRQSVETTYRSVSKTEHVYDRGGDAVTHDALRLKPTATVKAAPIRTGASATASSVAGRRTRAPTSASMGPRARVSESLNPEWDASISYERACRPAGNAATHDVQSTEAAAGARRRTTRGSSLQVAQHGGRFRLADKAVDESVSTTMASVRVGGGEGGQKRADRREILRWMDRLGVKVPTKPNSRKRSNSGCQEFHRCDAFATCARHRKYEML